MVMPTTLVRIHDVPVSNFPENINVVLQTDMATHHLDKSGAIEVGFGEDRVDL